MQLNARVQISGDARCWSTSGPVRVPTCFFASLWNSAAGAVLPLEGKPGGGKRPEKGLDSGLYAECVCGRGGRGLGLCARWARGDSGRAEGAEGLQTVTAEVQLTERTKSYIQMRSVQE